MYSKLLGEDTLEKEHLIQHGFKRPSYMIKSLEYCELDLSKDTKQILAEAKSKWRYNHKKSLIFESRELKSEI